MTGMRRLSSAILFALALCGCAGAMQQAQPGRGLSQGQLAAVKLSPAAAAAELNAYRASKGLKPVRLDPALAAMAERQAKAMASAGQLSHDVGGGFASRLGASGIGASEAGENLGGGYLSLDQAMTGWRHSPEHDANLLMANATRFGIAMAKNPDSEYGVYWAMEVAAEPLSASRGAFLPFSGYAHN